jgi:hypothetical protein
MRRPRGQRKFSSESSWGRGPSNGSGDRDDRSGYGGDRGGGFGDRGGRSGGDRGGYGRDREYGSSAANGEESWSRGQGAGRPSAGGFVDRRAGADRGSDRAPFEGPTGERKRLILEPRSVAIPGAASSPSVPSSENSDAPTINSQTGPKDKWETVFRQQQQPAEAGGEFIRPSERRRGVDTRG